ncbi:MAG: transporter [Hyphomicrobiales bacterium]|nr:transporter [Hyphomicrobiales bacterium]MDE2114528.1 transporter [Hyphomicrobiales bacterium]
MLKGINPLLGPELLHILRAMGHGDEIAIVDGNYPAERDAERLVRMEGHGAPIIVDAVLSVMPLDDFAQSVFRPGIFNKADHLEPIMISLQKAVSRHEPKAILEPLMGQAFYDRVKGAYAIIASGEPALYGNIILRKGVIRPEA